MLPLDRRPSLTIALRRGTALVAVLAAVGVGATTAEAIGVGVDATVIQERAIIAQDAGRQETTVSFSVKPTRNGADRAAVVVPVDGDARTSALTAEQAAVFPQLDQATAPRSDRSGDQGADTAERAPLNLPDGAFRLSTITSTDGLRRWLARRGDDAIAPAARRALDRHARNGGRFTVLTLEGAVAGTVQNLLPVRISVPGDRSGVSLRASAAAGDPVSIDLYVVGPHRVTGKGFDTYYAGYVEDLEPPLDPATAGVLGSGTYLTRLAMVAKDPTMIAGDVRFEQGVSDRLFRASADYPFESEAGFATAPLPSESEPEVPFDGPPGWLWLVLIPGVIVLVALVGLGLRLRSRAPGGRA